MAKKIVWSVLVILLLAAGGIVFLSTQRPDSGETDRASYGAIERIVRGSGRVEGLGDPTTLSFGGPGYVAKISVKEGQEIDPEENVVAELDPSELDIRIAQAKASVKEATAKLKQVKMARPPEVIKQAEEKMRQAAEEVNAAESRLKALQEPPVPPPAEAYEIAEAARSVERARQKLVLEETALNRLKAGATADEKAAAAADVAIATEKLNREQKKARKSPSIFAPEETVEVQQANVDLARKELQKAEVERDRVLRGASPHDLAAAEARVNLAKTEVESAEAAKERLEHPKRPRPAPDYVIAEAHYALAQAQARLGQQKAALEQLQRGPEPAEVEAAEAANEQAEKSLSLLKIHREGLQLRAPFAGLVTRVHAQPGTLVPAFSPIVTMVNFSKKQVRAEFDVARLPDIKKGMPVALSSKAFKEGPDNKKETLNGTVERIVSVGIRRLFIDDPAATRGGEVVEVLIGVDDPRSELKKEAFNVLLPGLRMDAAITLERHEKVLRVPKSYIANDGSEFVWLKGKAPGEVSKRPVKCGMRDEAFVEILEGLADGEEIVKPAAASRR